MEDSRKIAEATSADPSLSAAAIGFLYDKYAPQLLGVAKRVLGNASEAEDLLHDLFVSLPERGRHYSPERGSATTWLLILVRNMAIDRLRRTGRRTTILRIQGATESLHTTQEPSPESATVSATEHDRVSRALTALPEAQRLTLEAAFFGGLTYPEIAARDSVSLGTVKSRAARGLAAMREALRAGDSS